ncbi:DNA polymeras-like protein zeta catalytic subunit [Lepidopterella palustris CBS 459.81]|uniref:DNA polymerase n=1 Tax=Lepidopterella palustris CBS 459.81 TaxID=1314670 RepID=A0A8E2JG64_9PEZI|nr:DNA polymeras-like protein zeta catalytic subunit [Lepidopterella palustris CBS 459.81]
MDTFRFRLNCIDHYQATPTDLDPQLCSGSGLSQRQNAPPVPIIRIFGTTETGQNVCAHIHGALPYLYVQYDGGLDRTSVNSHIQQLRVSIDHALAGSYRQHAYDGKAVFVGHITLVKGIPFYGYHVGYKFFLKIYLLNPLHMTRLADLLHQGAIMNKVLQPHESHLQYLLQWMCDYNLYGCAYIDCSTVKFRSPLPECVETSGLMHQWHDGNIPENLISDPDYFPRQSHCSIEVDVCVHNILNRKEISPRPIHHDFIERFSHLSKDEKFVHSMAGLWRDETRRRKMRLGLTDSSSSPFPPEVLVSMSANPRNLEKGGWIHEDEYRQLLEGLVKEEKAKNQDSIINFDTFVKPVGNEDYVQTALESVEDLFPHNLSRSGFPLDDIPDESAANSGELGGLNDVQGVQQEEPKYDCSETEEPILETSASSEDNEGLEDVQKVPDSGAQANCWIPRKRSLPSVIHSPNKRMKSHTVTGPDSNISEDPGCHSSKVDGSSREVAFHAQREEKSEFEGSNTNSSSPIGLDDSIPRLSQSSQSSIKAYGAIGPTTRSFAVVKHPHDPETMLRLSQSGYSNSQQSPTTQAPKSASFEPCKVSPQTPWRNIRTPLAMVESSSPAASKEPRSLVAQLSTTVDASTTSRTYYFSQLPPTSEIVDSTMIEAGMPPVIYQDAYYSNENDVPERPREYAGREFKLESRTLPFLPIFDPSGTSLATYGERPPLVLDKAREQLGHHKRRQRSGLRHWEIAALPPSSSEVDEWLVLESQHKSNSEGGKVDFRLNTAAESLMQTKLSQIDGPTQRNKHGFKYSQKQKSTNVKRETQYMSIMSLEVHINTRGNLVPDPAEDEIACVFWCFQSDEDEADSSGARRGILVLSAEDGIAKNIAKQVSVEVEYEENELDLINRMVDVVREFDPDILTGYEVHNGSWGYMIERARFKYGYNLCDEFSRMKTQSHGRFGKDADSWGFTHTSTIRVTGRHMINIWRAMRGELSLLQYTMENVVFHLLHKRIPHYSCQDLTSWYQSSKPRDLAKLLDYFLSRVQLNLEILEVNELVSRTSEQARLLGVDFFSVFSRGSQFKVESLMFRIAKPESFILVSPSRKQVGQQNALECLPLVMEPQSGFYNGPLLVLDFQSLYPSVMIAYNYCYSTCLGRIVSWRGKNKMGFTDFEREPQLLELLEDYINIAPNGMMYVKPEMRKSLLAKMLGEILETRVMVKSGMKVDKDDKALQQLLNNRQLALKLIANVTYGYTSASFSGRMPCSEIADSIVQTGRETLEKAIALIHANERWGAEVVYGDTDSLFVYLKGRTRDQAFTIGEEIAAAVTAANPRPIKLKFEKVYHPCVLLAKKRYVGFKYESRSQTEPEFDAKGIETVRRDGTPAEQKIEEKALKILFRTADLSEVKRYFQSQCAKIMAGQISIQDFLFAKEVKLGNYSDKRPPPPGVLIATKRMLADPRTEPQYGERVPYIVVTGAPGARLVDRCVSPETLLLDRHLELDAEYYISKNLIPPLERIFNLVGANVRQWYDEMPKVQRIRNVSAPNRQQDAEAGFATLYGVQTGPRKTLESYMKSASCLVCRSKLAPPPSNMPDMAVLPLCMPCTSRPARTLWILRNRLQKEELRAKNVDLVCRSCAGLPFGEEVRCDSRDCPVFYTRLKEKAQLERLREDVGGVISVFEGRKEGREEGKGVVEW